MSGFEWALVFVIVNGAGTGTHPSENMSSGIWDTGYRTIGSTTGSAGGPLGYPAIAFCAVL